MALAIIDDLGAIIIIAHCSTLTTFRWPRWRRGCSSNYGAGGAESVRRTPYGVYILVGVVLWTAVLKSGFTQRWLASLSASLFLKEKHGRSPAKRLEHVLHPWVAYLILPLFAFANAGVSCRASR